jgi:hypothetical protein
MAAVCGAVRRMTRGNALRQGGVVAAHHQHMGDVMSSKAHPPPVPPANRSPHGPGAQSPEGDMGAQTAEAVKSSRDRNLGQQGRQGDIKQNTTHQGYQQDR